jgi:hypothetical protein
LVCEWEKGTNPKTMGVHCYFSPEHSDLFSAFMINTTKNINLFTNRKNSLQVALRNSGAKLKWPQSNKYIASVSVLSVGITMW